MRFRPCIDLHGGVVKQIIGSTLRDDADPSINFAADRPARYFAELYRQDGLYGGHVIMLGPGNEAAAAQALAAFPHGLQIGGGVTPDNAPLWLQRGAAGVIVTSYIFHDGRLHAGRLQQMVDAVGTDCLILDLSCRKRDGRYVAMTHRWQTYTDFEINRDNLAWLAASCCEFLIHATAVEGKQGGIDAELVALLGDITPRPTTYAGGIRNIHDITLIQRLGQGRLDYTVGSALDIFGGQGLRYRDLVTLPTADL
jgi:phosphoribosylformimino-5-aminoimidazole carboxamide ribotide isomerase